MPLHYTFTQPEERSAMGAKTLEIRVPGRAVLAVVIVTRGDPQWRQDRFVETDGALDIAYRQENMIQHGKALK
jgi:hypothetical protein